MELVEILRDAMDRIADPVRWTQGASARDASGQELGSGRNSMATAWCSAGSVQRATPVAGYQSTKSIGILNDVAISMDFKNIVDLNDNGTHEDVMLMFKHAIVQAESASIF